MAVMTEEKRPEDRAKELSDEELEGSAGGAVGVGGSLPAAPQRYSAAGRPAAPAHERTGG